jgi:Tfp pilus assembly protein PilO
VTRRQQLIGVAAALGVLVFWFLFLWGPQGSKLSDAKDRRERAQSEQDQLQVRIARLKSLQQDEPQKRAQLERLRVAIPDEPNLAQFILDANNAANVSGINFLSIAPSPPAPVGAVPGATPPSDPGTTPAPSSAPAVINLQMSVTGGYFQVIDFVNRLNGLPRLVVIDSLNLSTGGQGTAGATTLSAEIAARLFVSETTPVAGAPGTPGATTTTTAPATTSTTTP